jgi:hypothetical protein
LFWSFPRNCIVLDRDSQKVRGKKRILTGTKHSDLSINKNVFGISRLESVKETEKE